MKHNLLKSLTIVIILLIGSGTVFGGNITNISDVWLEGSMNSWTTKPTNWKFSTSDNNHYTGTFYIKYSSTNYAFKYVAQDQVGLVVIYFLLEVIGLRAATMYLKKTCQRMQAMIK